MSPHSTSSSPDTWQGRWQRFSAAVLRAFHAYANWLVGISWRRFIVLALLLLVVVGIVHDLPPFTWTVTEHFDEEPKRASASRPGRVPPPVPPLPPVPKEVPVRVEQGKPGEGLDISIGKDGIRINTKPGAAGASAPPGAASAAEPAIRIVVPPGVIDEKDMRAAVEAARKQIEEDVRAAREDMEQARQDAEEARRDAESALAELTREQRSAARSGRRVTRFGIGDFLMQFTFLWIVASAIIKFTYKGQKQAEKKAQVATETAEAESLRRQVVEARMAAMQAQVEPHFLFNTLASIDHLIETDPPRASQMQKNLIALLRASMPTMREAAGVGGTQGNGVRDLGREIAVIRPYLEILKVRMEERLTTQIDVPEGLHSAEFPPMMLQTLVENAIKHGLEPKAEGGHLRVAAQIVHGKLQMTVADTGLGFGKAATAGTGVGLANIRERLQMLYGNRATLTVAENQPSGTVVTITVPYKTVEGNAA
jgi:signal transduction histidine kinase